MITKEQIENDKDFVSRTDDGSIKAERLRYYITEVESLQSENKELREKLGDLVSRLELVHADYKYSQVWVNSFMHTGHQYDGPTYTEEFEAAQSLLSNNGRPS